MELLLQFPYLSTQSSSRVLSEHAEFSPELMVNFPQDVFGILQKISYQNSQGILLRIPKESYSGYSPYFLMNNSSEFLRDSSLIFRKFFTEFLGIFPSEFMRISSQNFSFFSQYPQKFLYIFLRIFEKFFTLFLLHNASESQANFLQKSRRILLRIFDKSSQNLCGILFSFLGDSFQNS